MKRLNGQIYLFGTEKLFFEYYLREYIVLCATNTLFDVILSGIQQTVFNILVCHRNEHPIISM